MNREIKDNTKKILPKNKQKLIYLRWQDAFEYSGWLSSSELENMISE